MTRQELITEGYRWYNINQWEGQRYIILYGIDLRPGLQLLDVLTVRHDDLYNDNMCRGAWVNDPDEGRYCLVARNGGGHHQYERQVLPIQVVPGNQREAREQLLAELDASDGYGLSGP